MADRDIRSSLIRVLEAQSHLRQAQANLPSEYDDVEAHLDELLTDIDAVRDALEGIKHDSRRWRVEPETAARDSTNEASSFDAK